MNAHQRLLVGELHIGSSGWV